MSLSISVALIFFSCKKANDERNDANKPPVAIAETDHVISLPTDSISLDGSASHDPDGTISEWLWTRVYAGIHTRYVCEAGRVFGQNIANNILNKVKFLKD